ncbi:hypothetical protein [Dielma fastidiosa]|uniref:Uncharacterized protein n=1 Tax=Dielma fastidiosa TaxID=1034346 RepID=A0AB35UP67_9FIRM|nr:hypothetical protein [Dielma fastidiosa]MDY5168583.1 hypothetical protein [Dielma fastidiosa]
MENISPITSFARRTESLTVERYRFLVDNTPDWFLERVEEGTILLYNCSMDHLMNLSAEGSNPFCEIKTPFGSLYAGFEQYIIKDGDMIYPMQELTFSYLYDDSDSYFYEDTAF